MGEPTYTAFALVTFGVLLFISALFSRAAGRVGVPVALLFIGIGVLSGTEGIGGIDFQDYRFSFRAGTVALVLILFDGGLNTSFAAAKAGIKPASVLATLGVMGTAAIVAVAAGFFGFSWKEAALLGAIVSSTDAAAVFSVLRGSGLHLKKRVGATLELESGLNDPMAVILTVSLTASLTNGEPLGWAILGGAALHLFVGASLGLAIGYAGRFLLERVHLPAAGLYPALTLALACLSFGIPTLFQGSGFLAVYIAAIVIGNGPLHYRAGLLRVHDAIAWLSQILMFLLLGLLPHPSELLMVGWTGLGLGLVLAFVARPFVVALCLLPFRYKLNEVLYVGWVGLRGAVPIVLATFPVLAGAPGAHNIFNVVFFIVVVNSLVPGATVPWVTRKLGLVADSPPAPPAVLEVNSNQSLTGELHSFYIRDASAVAGATIADLPFPATASALLIVRDKELIAPKGATTIQPADHVYVFCKHDDVGFVHLMFGQEENE